MSRRYEHAATVLTSNKAMMSVFHHSGYKVTTTKEEDTFEVSFRFDEGV